MAEWQPPSTPWAVPAHCWRHIYPYLWSNGPTTQTATGLGAGTVYVTITDSMGCIVQATVIVPAGSTLL
ncbi:MAG: hypothetical protein IPP29_20800 [Bacteroidetes bacterium]|nr:hypothetical protein [Bacteroidota bacterium]